MDQSIIFLVVDHFIQPHNLFLDYVLILLGVIDVDHS